MANNDKENKIKKFTKEAIGKTLNQFNKEIGIADLVEINKNQDRILNGILSQVNDENTEKTEKSNIITLDNSTDGIVELKEIQGDTNVNVSKIEEMPITHDIGDKEGNVFTLNEIPKGAISIGEIQGNTMVNCNKDDKKELVLMKDLSTEGYSNITLNKGVDGGLVDVALEGNTLVNVCDQKDPVAITKSYTVETGNHVALQGEYDGKCRPVVTGNTLVNLCNQSVSYYGYRYPESSITWETGERYIKATTDGNCQLLYLTPGKILSIFPTIKASTTYTILLSICTNVTGVSFMDGNTANATAFGEKIRDGVFIITTPADMSTINNNLIYFVPDGNLTKVAGSIFEIGDVVILEGDYTNKPIPGYFEGLQSSFEDKVVTQEMVDNGEELAENLGKYKVDYVVTGKNKVNQNLGVINSSYGGSKTVCFPVKPNTTYIYTSSKYKGSVAINEISGFIPHDTLASNIGNYSIKINDISSNQHFTTSSRTKYIFMNYDKDSDVQLEEGSTATTYEPYKEYKKTFYLNSPLLEGDTIEQQGDNVVHVHRYKEVVLDGSENWVYWGNNTDNGGLSSELISFYLTMSDRNYIQSDEGSRLICNKFTCNNITVWESKKEGIALNNDSTISLQIAILRSRLSTQDTAGFKQWLQQNPTTVIYQLATPQYEVISTNDTILCDSYTNGHLDVDSAVPIKKVDFLSFEKDLTYLYANTQYTVQFVSDNAIIVDITLGGKKLLAQSIIKGLNKITITTPSELVDNKLIIDGVGASIKEVVVTNSNRDFGYFEGMKSVGECEDLEVISSNKNLFDEKYLLGGQVVTFNGKKCYRYLDNKDNFKLAMDFKPNTRYTLALKHYREDSDSSKNIAVSIKYTDGTDDTIAIPSANTRILTSDEGKTIKTITGDWNWDTVSYIDLEATQLEEGSTATDYIPHSHNTQTLIHEPLRGIGEIKDKYVLIDGKWYIERNWGEVVLDGSSDEGWYETSNHYQITLAGSLRINLIESGKGISDTMPVNNLNDGIHLYPILQDGVDYIRVQNARDKWATKDDFTTWLSNNPVTLIYPIATPTYKPIDYNPFTVYSDVTHISNNSTIPCNMTIKNTGYNCLLKPSTTYTVSSNLGLNTVTTPSVLTEDCLRFYDTDTSTVTTMKNVMVLEGDYTTGKPIPSHFSGIESAFEQEYDEAVGKYKVKIRVQNEDASKENYIEFYINEPLRGIGDVKDKVYVKDDKVVVERNCASVTLDGNNYRDWLVEGNVNKTISFMYIRAKKVFKLCSQLLYCDTLPVTEVYNKDIEGIDIHSNLNLHANVHKSKLETQDVAGFKQWLQQNPTTIVYQLASPVYEEVEYSSNRLILNTFNNESFNNSTLFLDTTILPKLSFKPLWEELVYVKSNTKYYIQFNAVGSGEVVISLGGTELTTEIVEGYNCIPITTPSESTNLMTIIGQGITISEVVVSEVVCGGYYKGLQSCFEEHMENGKYRVLLRGIALDGSKVNGIKLYINEPLRGVGDVKDRLCIKNGKLMVERKCSEAIFDGSDDEKWTLRNHTQGIAQGLPCDRYALDGDAFKDGKEIGDYYSGALCDKLKVIKGEDSQNKDIVGIVVNGGTGNWRLMITTKLDSKPKFISWLQQNPLTVVYQLAEPVYEEATNEYGLPIVFEGYENGIVYIDSAVTPTTHIKYTSNNQLATTLSEAEEQNIATQEDINMNVITYMMDIDMMLTDMEMSNDISVMAVRRDNSNENMLDRMSEEDKKVYRDNTVVMLEKMITANVLEKEDIERRINMYYDKNRISKEQYKYLKSLL